MAQNVTMLEGNVGGVPQLKMYKNAAGEPLSRCWFKLAVTRKADRGKPRAEQRTSWFSIVTWGKAAEQHAQFINKGDQISVVGEMICESRLKPGSTTEYDEFNSVNAEDIQYLQRATKNLTGEQLQERIAISLARIEELTKGEGAVPASAPAAGSTVLPDLTTGEGNPFTADGSSPLSTTA
jgi:single-stranded DNA-binding protein